MSYTRSYSENIHVSGSVRYSYPKSESGGSGTAYYQQNVPVNINIHVDTDPFDNSVNSCNHSLNGLAGAVGVMNVAQCAAIQQKTAVVSNSIVSGFYGLISSELSQQVAELKSIIDSKLGLILQYSKRIDNQKKVMNDDYHRITSRYISVFDNLDEECYKRIYALDELAFRLDKISTDLLVNSFKDNVGNVIIQASDFQDKSNKIQFANLKKKVIETITTVGNLVTQEKRYDMQLQQNISNEKIDKIENFYAPLVYLKKQAVESDATVSEEVVFSSDYFDNCALNDYSQAITDFFRESSDATECTESDKQKIVQEVENLIEEKQSLDDSDNLRIYKTMQMLLQNI